MDRKKFYLTIGGIALVMILVVAFAIGIGGNKTEVSSKDTTTSIVNAPAINHSEETTSDETLTQSSEAAITSDVETTTSGKEETTTSGDRATTPGNGITSSDNSETAEPESETTEPSDDTADPHEGNTYEKGDLTEEGHVYYPDFDIDNAEDLDAFIKEYSPREDLAIVRFVDGDWEGLVSREDDVIQVIKRTKSEQIVTLYFDDGRTILSHEKYDEAGNIVYRFREASGSSIVTESYFTDGIETRTVKNTETGITKTLKVKTITIDETVCQRLIYIDTGMGMVQSFEYADFANGILSEMTVSEGGKTYTWNMDGKGNDVENIVSLTIGGNTIPRKDINLTIYTTPPGQINNY